MDSGANRSITPYKHLLHNLQRIPTEYVDDIGGQVCVEYVGHMKIRCNDDSYLWVQTYYNKDAPETIVSPNNIVMASTNTYSIWTKYCNVKTGTGHISLLSESGLDHATIDIAMSNGLWYTHQCETYFQSLPPSTPIIRKMHAGAEFELWHQRLGHAGDKALANVHKCADGIPNLPPNRQYFYKCECCMRGKVIAAVKNKHTTSTAKRRGEQFHMDFGFVRGSSYKSTNEKGKLVTSKDGYNSYLLIVDAFTRYSWVFLTSTKHPPIQTIKTFLEQYGVSDGTHKQIWCDQGGELARSGKFREIVE